LASLTPWRSRAATAQEKKPAFRLSTPMATVRWLASAKSSFSFDVSESRLAERKVF
jgi:hypothetical protein